jgi:hypothetical protein
MSELNNLQAPMDISKSDLSQGKEILDQFSVAVKKANATKPSKADRAELDRFLREFPILWEMAGDLMEQAAQKLILNMNGSYAVEATLRTGWQELPKQLARPSDGKLERLLVQQAVLCWLQLGYIEHQYNYFLTEGNTTVVKADFWERRLNAAQRRYLRALETLARVRRLNLPAMQVNIGAQQVNQVNAGS